MRFTNDHDPLPLLGRVQARCGQAVDVVYRQRDAEGDVIDFILR